MSAKKSRKEVDLGDAPRVVVRLEGRKREVALEDLDITFSSSDTEILAVVAKQLRVDPALLEGFHVTREGRKFIYVHPRLKFALK